MWGGDQGRARREGDYGGKGAKLGGLQAKGQLEVWGGESREGLWGEEVTGAVGIKEGESLR